MGSQTLGRDNSLSLVRRRGWRNGQSAGHMIGRLGATLVLLPRSINKY